MSPTLLPSPGSLGAFSQFRRTTSSPSLGLCAALAPLAPHSVVTWNPREATGSAIADMEAGGWDHYVCVEPGFANGFKTLQPGEEWIGQQVLTAL